MGAQQQSSSLLDGWPEQSREAAQLVIDEYGEPDEATETTLTWHQAGPWKRIIATRTFYPHNFPVPHIDCVESVIDYKVPPEKVSDLVAFDGSVVVERTAGEISARCHDEQANLLALNLAHDLVSGRKTVEQARDYYAKEFVDYRRRKPTPYMEKLRFKPGNGETRDPDMRVVSDQDMEAAARGGTAERLRAKDYFPGVLQPKQKKAFPCVTMGCGPAIWEGGCSTSVPSETSGVTRSSPPAASGWMPVR